MAAIFRHLPLADGGDGGPAVQQSNTATSPTASGSERFLSAADLPQRLPATAPPRVRIEGVRDSIPCQPANTGSSRSRRHAPRNTQDARSTMIIINDMVCWVGTSWAGWQERQDHAGCKIIDWSRADGHEHTGAPSRRRPMGLVSPTAASRPRSASSSISAPSASRPRRWPSCSAALPDQTA